MTIINKLYNISFGKVLPNLLDVISSLLDLAAANAVSKSRKDNNIAAKISSLMGARNNPRVVITDMNESFSIDRSCKRYCFIVLIYLCPPRQIYLSLMFASLSNVPFDTML